MTILPSLLASEQYSSCGIRMRPMNMDSTIFRMTLAGPVLEQGPHFPYPSALDWVLPSKGSHGIYFSSTVDFKCPKHIPSAPDSICYTTGLSSHCDPAEGEPRLPRNPSTEIHINSFGHNQCPLFLNVSMLQEVSEPPEGE